MCCAERRKGSLVSKYLGDKEPGDMATVRAADLTSMSVYRVARPGGGSGRLLDPQNTEIFGNLRRLTDMLRHGPRGAPKR